MDSFGNVISPLWYCSIIAGIPKLWKQIIKAEEWNRELDKDLKIDSWETKASATVSNKMYWKTLGDYYPPRNAFQCLWEIELGLDMEEDVWWSLFPEFLKIIKPVKLRYIQYRVLTHSLTTNNRRNKWDSNVSPYCSFCNEQTETILHILVKCPIVSALWKNLARCMQYFLQVKWEPTPVNIILNNDSSKEKLLINFMIIVMKQYIYSCKCLGDNPTYEGYMQKLSYWHLIEKYIVNCTEFQWKHNKSCSKIF